MLTCEERCDSRRRGIRLKDTEPVSGEVCFDLGVDLMNRRNAPPRKGRNARLFYKQGPNFRRV